MDMSVPTLHVPRPARGTVTPSQIFTALWRGRWPMLACGLVLAALCFVVASQLPRRYTGSGALVIETQHLIPELQGALSSDGSGDAQLSLHTGMQELESRPLLLAVADELGFANDPRRNPLLRPPGLLQRMQTAALVFVMGETRAQRPRTIPPACGKPSCVR